MKTYLVFFLILFTGFKVCGQSVPEMKFVAGTGVAGFSDSPAQFHKPIRLAPYGENAVLVADIYNHALRAVRFDGTTKTIAGGPGKIGYQDGPDLVARFNSPHGVAFNLVTGEIVIGEAGNHTIRLLTPLNNDLSLWDRTYSVSTLAGTAGREGFKEGTTTEALFNSPHAIAFTPEGAIIVADIGNARIRQIKDNIVTVLAGNGESGNSDGDPLKSSFVYPMDLVVAGENVIFIADAGSNLIRILIPGISVTTMNLSEALKTPHGIAVDGRGNFYIADMKSHRILQVKPDGVVRTICGNGSAGKQVHELNRPAAVLVHCGYLWIADLDNHQIKVVKL